MTLEQTIFIVDDDEAYRDSVKELVNSVGATASRRGGPKSLAFSSAKVAQRALAESMARSLWPQGVHVSLIVIDGIVDLPRTRAMMKDKPAEFFVAPDGVAETAWWLTQQARTAWTFEAESRPFGETW